MSVNVVFGAGGPTGLECVKRLLAATDSPVRAVVRDPQKYDGKFPVDARLEVVKGDVTDKDSVRSALQNSKGAIFAASAMSYWAPADVDFKGVATVADISKDVGVQHVVLVSSMLVSPHNRMSPLRMFLNNIRYSLMDNKYKGEEYLRSSGVSYTVVRPGGLTSGPGGEECIQARQGDKADAGGRITRADVAAVCVEALSNPAARNVTLEVVAKGKLEQPLNELLSNMFNGLTPGGA